MSSEVDPQRNQQNPSNQGLEPSEPAVEQLSKRVQAEIYIKAARSDANQLSIHYPDAMPVVIGGGEAPFRDSAEAAKPTISHELYDFLDGDSPEAIEATHLSRLERLRAEGMQEGSAEHWARLRNLELQERGSVLAERVLPGEANAEAREAKRAEFQYIVEFWERSTMQLPIGAETGGGKNLAPRPFLSPSGPLPNSEFQMNESYRWDEPFQNHGLILGGGSELALGQLKNKIDVFRSLGLIPNALTLTFMTHGQPPLEAMEAQDLMAVVGPGEWYGAAMKTVEQDLWNNWLDAGRGLKDERQAIVKNPINIFEDNWLLTRHSNIHFDSTLVGCEDGKDHYEITRAFGDHYLPVQLNAILQGHFEALQDYYGNYGSYETGATEQDLAFADTQAARYAELADEHKRQFQEVFWEDSDGWQGFRNYALEGNTHDGQEGRIKFDDLSSEVFPLAFGLATPEQAEIIKSNILDHYVGDQGLSSTGKAIRPGVIDTSRYQEPNGFQWSNPNCWPPLVSMAVNGLERYGFVEEAKSIMTSWVAAQEKVFDELGYFPEKTPYDSSFIEVNRGLYGKIAGGFGWTIGVYLDFLNNLATSEAPPSSPAPTAA